MEFYEISYEYETWDQKYAEASSAEVNIKILAAIKEHLLVSYSFTFRMRQNVPNHDKEEDTPGKLYSLVWLVRKWPFIRAGSLYRFLNIFF